MRIYIEFNDHHSQPIGEFIIKNKTFNSVFTENVRSCNGLSFILKVPRVKYYQQVSIQWIIRPSLSHYAIV